MRRLPLSLLLDPSRRSFLRAAGVGLAAVAAGCTGDKSSAEQDGVGSPCAEGDTGTSGGGETGATGDTGGGADTGGGWDSGGGDTGGGDTGGGDTGGPEGLCEDAALPEVEECVVTPDRGAGPFYREDSPARTELNVTGEESDEGLVVCGRVVDEECRPIPGAEVEVWHVGPDGTYDNDSGDYRFRGVITTDEEGTWGFSSIMPIYYVNDAGGTLPLHVHLRITAPGFPVKITQFNFAHDDLLDERADPRTVVDAPLGSDGYRRGTFDVVLSRP